jgi:hypothetical protein
MGRVATSVLKYTPCVFHDLKCREDAPKFLFKKYVQRFF